MRLTLGAHDYDLSTRALVVASLDARQHTLAALCRRAETLAGEGADLFELVADPDGDGDGDGDNLREIAVEAVRALVDGFGLPVAIRTTSTGVVRGALQAGASLAPDLDPAAATPAGAAVVVRAPDADGLAARARAAEAAGVPPGRIVVDPGLGGQPGLLASARRFAALGYPVVLDATCDARSAALTTAALGVIGGCRMVRAADVRGVRRVCDVLAAILEADP